MPNLKKDQIEHQKWKDTCQGRIIYWLTGANRTDCLTLARIIRDKQASEHNLTANEMQLGITCSDVLGLGWGPSRLQDHMELLGVKGTQRVFERSVDTYRRLHPAAVKAYQDLDLALRAVCRTYGTEVKLFNNKVHVKTLQAAGTWVMTVRTPSGHSLIYESPRLVRNDAGKEDVMVSGWASGSSKTWGGKVLEDVVWDIFRALNEIGILRASEAPARRVQVLSPSEAETAWLPPAGLPEWAAGLPLEGLT
jgi:hypothetical protein